MSQSLYKPASGPPVYRPPLPPPPGRITVAGGRVPDPPPGPLLKVGTALWGVPRDFYISPASMDVHVAILAESGGGKSFLAQLILRLLLKASLGPQSAETVGGVFLLDPDNDLADNLIAYGGHLYAKLVAAGKVAEAEAFLRKINVLTIEDDVRFRYDPFADLPRRSECWNYDELLLARSERLMRQVVRRVAAADLESMNRLIRRSKVAICASGCDRGNGRYHGFDKALALSTPDHPDFDGLLDPVYPHLPKSVQATYREIMQERVPPSVKGTWESTWNRFDRVLTGAVAMCLSKGPSWSPKKAIENAEFTVVRGRESKAHGPEAANNLGGLLLDGILMYKDEEESHRPEHERVPFNTWIDEAGDYAQGEDLQKALCRHRKLRNRIALLAQNVPTLCKGDQQLADYLLSQCGLIFCGGQRLKESREMLADRLMTGNLSLTKEYQIQQHQEGWIPIQSIDCTVSGGGSRTWSSGGAKGKSESDGTALGEMRALSLQQSQTDSEGETLSHTDGRSASDGGVRENQSVTMQPVFNDDHHQIGIVPVYGYGTNVSEPSDSRTKSDGIAQTKATAVTAGQGLTLAGSRVQSHSLALSTSESWAKGGSDSWGWAASLKNTLLANIVSEYVWSGRFVEGSVADQRAMQERALHVLTTGEFCVSALGCPSAFFLKVDHVKEVWDRQNKWVVTQRFIRMVCARHDYCFDPRTKAEPGKRVDDDVTDVHPDVKVDDEGFGN